MALHQFHDAYGKFPPAHTQDPTNILPDNFGQPNPPDTSFYISWMARILPYIEQKAIYDRIRWGEDAFWHGEEGDYLNGKQIDLYLCPSNTVKKTVYVDPALPDLPLAATHFLGLNGEHQFNYDGMLYINSRVRLAEVKDGTSQTLLVGERPPAYEGYMGWWFAGAGWHPWFGSPDVVLGSNEFIAVDGSSTPQGRQSKYQPGRLHNDPDQEHAWHFWSQHPSGSNFVFTDGHVVFIPYSVDGSVLRNLATRDKGEAINANF
jgi:prepilin-type processing-associated H-X9-DG protein